jgi:flagellar hook-length control protein FliK
MLALRQRAPTGASTPEASATLDSIVKDSAWPSASSLARQAGIDIASTGTALVGEGSPRLEIGLAPNSSAVDQIARWSEMLFERGKQEISIQLEPDNLGKVRIHVAARPEGLSITLSAEHLDTKDYIEAHLPELRTTLEHHGHKVEGFDVTYEPIYLGYGYYPEGEARNPSSHARQAVIRQWDSVPDAEDTTGSPSSAWSVSALVDYWV